MAEEKQNTQELTDDNFDSVINNNDLVLVDFWAEWCGPCKVIAPIIEEIGGEYNDVVIGKLDVDNNDDITQKFKIKSIPTLKLFKNGEQVDELSGSQTKDKIKEMIDNNLNQ